ncbi:hypothetical protein L1049_027168 [Liquidambar formosana]|uniref:AT-hook motif nuclear-localized protein n=1 Tax=Liquidambar formosana TaxID=63359 RepID=A0AAP0R3C2_LIQFO
MDSREAQAPPPGMMVGPNSYGTSLPNNSSMISPNSAATMMPNPRFPFNSMVTSASKPMDSLNTMYDGGSASSGLRPGGFNIDPAKKKRGRPRKYAPDGNIALGLSPTPIASVVHEESSHTPSSEPQAKKNRGRPPGTGKKQLDALGPGGLGFTPHVITVKAGEDIASKIMAFSQQGPRTVCILSANGAICNVTLRQPAMSGGTVTYEGRFEIISLSGSFLLSESNGSRSRTGGLSVSLAGSDGRVLGGGVAGMLMAATPVQVIVGSFIADGKKSNSNLSISGPSSAPLPHMLSFGAPVIAASPPSQGASSDSSDENGNSPIDRGSGPYMNSSQPIHSMPMYPSMGWANSSMKILPN